MLPRPFELLKVSWPVGAAAIPFGAIHYLLLTHFTDSIEAYGKMRHYTLNSEWGGIEVLFVLNSGALGWVGAKIMEHRLSESGPVIVLVSSSWSLASIGCGFVLASRSLGGLTDTMWEMLAYALVSAVGASMLRTYLGSIQ